MTLQNKNDLSRSEKILVFMYEFGKGNILKVRYEDIVVGLFKKYPQDFHLKGYPEYPDSGDLIHKPLYDFKKKGYINAINKIFSLTDRGLDYARQLTGKKENISSDDRLSRSASTEVQRIKNLEGLSLFVQGQESKLSESDLYGYLGVTVRTPKNAFIGRLETIDAMIKELKKQKDDLSLIIIKYHDFLFSKFTGVINFFKNN